MPALRFSLITVAGLAFTTSPALRAQYSSADTPKFLVEGLAGAVVPTFDIANTVKVGSMLGGTIGYTLNSRWVLMGEFDYGNHKDKATGTTTIKNPTLAVSGANGVLSFTDATTTDTVGIGSTAATTANVFNSVATTLHIGGAATTISLGVAGGTP